MWNEDEIKGKGKKIKGRIKDKAGEIIDNPELESEGEVEHIEGVVQESFGRTRRKAGEFWERVQDEIDEEEEEKK